MKNPKISGDAEVNIQGRQDVHTNARWKIFTNVSHYENDLIAVLLKISGGGRASSLKSPQSSVLPAYNGKYEIQKWAADR